MGGYSITLMEIRRYTDHMTGSAWKLSIVTRTQESLKT